VRPRVLRDDPQVAIEPARIAQVDAHSIDARFDWVDVGILEAGQHQPAIELDDARGGTDEVVDLPLASDGDDPLAADGQRARPRSSRIHRLDRPATEDEVGGLVGHRASSVIEPPRSSSLLG
jgi:hypothetical protein